jgi:hypothetical protein
MKVPIAVIIIAVLLVGAGAFYGGMRFEQSKTANVRNQYSRNVSGAEGRGGQRFAQAGVRPVSGKIIHRDESSITVELQDGSSKIILVTDQSSINKTEAGSKADLKDGEEVVIFGQENSDGSITAQNIQIGTQFRGRTNDLPQPDGTGM